MVLEPFQWKAMGLLTKLELSLEPTAQALLFELEEIAVSEAKSPEVPTRNCQCLRLRRLAVDDAEGAVAAIRLPGHDHVVGWFRRCR